MQYFDKCKLVRRTALQDPEELIEASEAYVFRFPKLNSTAKTFGELVSQNVHQAALLSIVTRAVWEFNRKPSQVQNKKGGRGKKNEDDDEDVQAPRIIDASLPVSIRLEAAMDEASCDHENVVRRIKKAVRRGTCKDDESVERLIGGFTNDPETMDDLRRFVVRTQFLQVCSSESLWEASALENELEDVLSAFEARRVVEWRLFVFVHRPDLDFTGTLLGLIDDNETMKERLSKQKAMGKGGGHGNGKQNARTACVADPELAYTKVDHKAWLDVLHHYSGDDRYLHPDTRNSLYLSFRDVVRPWDTKHLLHPARVFGIERCFDAILSDPIDFEQIRETSYIVRVSAASGRRNDRSSRVNVHLDQTENVRVALDIEEDVEDWIDTSSGDDDARESDSRDPEDLEREEEVRSVVSEERTAYGRSVRMIDSKRAALADTPLCIKFGFPNHRLVFMVDAENTKNLAECYMPCAVLTKGLSLRKRLLSTMRRRFALLENRTEEELFEKRETEESLSAGRVRDLIRRDSAGSGTGTREDHEAKRELARGVRVPNPLKSLSSGSAAERTDAELRECYRTGMEEAKRKLMENRDALASAEMERLCKISADRRSKEAHQGELPVDDNVISGDAVTEVLYRTEYDDLHDISEMLNRTMSKGLDDPKRAGVYHRNRTIAKRWLLDEFMEIHKDSESEIGKVAKILLRNAKKDGITEVSRKDRIFDPGMSPFANYVIGLMAACERLLMFYGAHRTFLLMLVGTLDAYTETTELFGIKFNMLEQGDPSAGKSYKQTALKRCRIQGTVTSITDSSNLVFTGEEHRTDMITFYEEFNGENFDRRNKNSNGRAVSVLKSKLTSFVVNQVALQFVGAKRVVVSTWSKQQECFILATNQDCAFWDKAFLSRFHVVMATSSPRPEKEMGSYQHAEAQMSEQQKALLNRFYAERMREQYISFQVEKAMHSGVLDQPTLSITNFMIDRIVNAMVRQKRVVVPPRLCKRIEIMVRRFTVLMAVQYLYNLPVQHFDLRTKRYVPNFYGQPFRESQLLEFDPYLRDELEVVLFCVGLFSDQIESPLNAGVAKVLREINETDDVVTQQGKMRFLPVVNTGVRLHGGYSSHANNANGGAGGSSGVTPYSSMASNPQASSTSSSSSGVRLPSVASQEFDYTYCAIGTGMKYQFAEKVRSLWGEESKPSANHILSVIESMATINVTSHSYEARTTEVIRDGRPVTLVIPVEGTQNKTRRPLLRTVDDYLYAHSSLIYGEGSSLSLAEVVKSCAEHEATLPRKILYGEIPDPRKPQFFATMNLRPCNKRSVHVNQNHWPRESLAMIGLQEDEIKKFDQGSRVKIMNVDEDFYANTERLKRLGVSCPSRHAFAFHPYRFYTDILGWFSANPSVPAFSYPDDAISADRDSEEELERLRSLGDIGSMSAEERRKYLAVNLIEETEENDHVDNELGSRIPVSSFDDGGATKTGKRTREVMETVPRPVIEMVGAGEALHRRLSDPSQRKVLASMSKAEDIRKRLGIEARGIEDMRRFTAALKDVIQKNELAELLSRGESLSREARERMVEIVRSGIRDLFPVEQARGCGNDGMTTSKAFHSTTSHSKDAQHSQSSRLKSVGRDPPAKVRRRMNTKHVVGGPGSLDDENSFDDDMLPPGALAERRSVAPSERRAATHRIRGF